MKLSSSYHIPLNTIVLFVFLCDEHPTKQIDLVTADYLFLNLSSILSHNISFYKIL